MQNIARVKRSLSIRNSYDVAHDAARVSIGYRALATVDGDAVFWFWIGSHADYDKLLAQL